MVISNTNQIKKANTAAVRKVLNGEHGTTIAEIVRGTGLSVPTVSRIIEEMISRSEALSCPEEIATGGRRARQYRLNGSYCYLLCIYFNRKTLWYDLCDAVGNSVNAEEIAVCGDDHSNTIHQLIHRIQEEYPALRAVSIGVPAWVDHDELRLIHEYPGFDLHNFRREIEKKFHLPCRITNDLKAIAAGYYSSHFPDKKISLCCIYLSDSGPGAGVIVNGSLLPGKAGFAGEIGYLPFGKGTLRDALTPEMPDSIRKEAATAAAMAMITLLNPDYLLFCTYGGRMPPVREIVADCRKKLPEEALPQFIETDDYHHYFLSGLRSIAEKIALH